MKATIEFDGQFDSVLQTLSAATGLGGDDVAEAGQRIAEVLEPTLRVQLLDVLSQVALTLTAQLPRGHVELRMAGRTAELVFVDEEPEPAAEPTPGDDLSARISLRLPDGLKFQVEHAAAREGVSTNAWIVRALARSVEASSPGPRRTGNRFQGFARG